MYILGGQDIKKWEGGPRILPQNQTNNVCLVSTIRNLFL